MPLFFYFLLLTLLPGYERPQAPHDGTNAHEQVQGTNGATTATTGRHNATSGKRERKQPVTA